METLQRLALALERHEAVTLVTIVAAPQDQSARVGHKLLIGQARVIAGGWDAPELEATALKAAAMAFHEGRPRMSAVQAAGGTYSLYCEPYIPDPALVLVGGGHVAQQTAEFAQKAGFRVTVVDDRPDFANRRRFPDAEQVICAPMAQAVRELELGPEHSVVLVTRGHQHDMRCLLEVVGRPVGYIGMIGSRTRVETIFELLETEHGIPKEQLARVHAPIGLDIGAETPAQIAISVVAELIKVRRGGTGVSLSQMSRRLNKENRVQTAVGGVACGS